MTIKPTTLEKIVRAKPLGGRPVWRAKFRLSASAMAWGTVVNDAGLPIAYATQRAAREAARFVGACWRLAGPPRADTDRAFG